MLIKKSARYGGPLAAWRMFHSTLLDEDEHNRILDMARHLAAPLTEMPWLLFVAKLFRSLTGQARHTGAHWKVRSADILGIVPDGKFVALEIKRPDVSYKPTPAQLEFLEAVKTCGGYPGIVACPAEVDRMPRPVPESPAAA
jgi:hypothetical protein